MGHCALSVNRIGVRKCPCFDVWAVIAVLIVIVERLTKVWILIKMTCIVGSKHWENIEKLVFID
jgi:lipoprotein signal peptidase